MHTEERAAHETELVRVLRSKAKSGPRRSKSDIAKDEADGEHYASFDHICALWNAAVWMTGDGLDAFYHDGPLPLSAAPRALYTTQDFLQVQWRSHWFLRHYCWLSIEPFIDIVHRFERDMTLATQEAGYSFIRDSGFVVNNAHFGAWGACTFHKDILETAQDLSQNVDPDDIGLMHFWPDIVSCMDVPPENKTETGGVSFSTCCPA